MPDTTFLDECDTVAQFAKRIGKARQAIYPWIARGLPVFDAFGKTLIHRPTADAWMAAQVRSKRTRRTSTRGAA